MPVEITPRGTYGTRPASGPRPLMKAGMSLVSGIMRLRGLPLVQLTTVGAKTGQERTSDLLALRESANSWVVIASYAGAANHPAWYFNMAKNPDRIWLRDGQRRARVEAANLTGEERDEAYAQLTKVWKGYAGYQQKTDRDIPVVRLTAVE